jgi:hypothetical protein
LAAATVNTEEAPAAIEDGAAEMVIVGREFADTVTVVTADVLPPIPVATAV